ncbi:putative bifunctional diguanylate cyclase/phosphodiesterase [Krasilnikovia sp. M28-CT-15]|uniref:putative bifunctional diguanylate cyclase/phosphodiesterase n=1 Tax=Krasilnikovia sp. M28-CT-15 TaxID=3373540 RepID=UPI003876DE7E
MVPSTTGRWKAPWLLFAAAGLTATAIYVADLSETASLLAFAVIGIGTVTACFAGPRRFGAEPRAAWRLMGAACLAFLVGVVVRPWAAAQPSPRDLFGDAATIPGYLMLGVFFVILLRARQSVERHAVLDGLIVCLAGGLASALLLAAPAAALTGRPPVESVLAGLYPLFDVVLLLLVVNLTFTARTWPVSLVTLLGTMVLMVTGDLAYAIIGLAGKTYTSPLLDVPFLLAYVLLGVTALHPSVVQLSRAARRPVQAWSGRRMALLAPAICVPFVLMVAVGARSPWHRLTIAIGGAAVVVLLLARAVSAVQAQVAAELHSEHQAVTDPLTGLPNRPMISERIARLVERTPPDGPHRVWVYYLDLDGFKWVNDSWGHDTGDQLVIEVATRLRAALPPAVTLARVGGDEFVLTYVGEQADALRVVDDVKVCFARPLPVRDTEVVITASVGIAHAAGDPNPAVTAEALLRDADTAMYRSKADGHGRSTLFDVSMHNRVRERIELEAALRTSLARGELRVAYQPIVNLETGQPLGAEALVRWEHPERGDISPATFIPIAEEAGLIGPIGTWVRNQALSQLARWRADGTVADDFYLSVNVSPRQLTDANLPLIVSAELMRYGVPASAVALEMTESVMVDGSSVTSRVLFELRELGLRLLVDDFGTGFSALGYLRRFPVTGVKIDRSFVSGLGASVEDEEIVRAVVAMSRALGLSIVAEGVETPTQRDALATVGVRQGQGWLWGRAMAPDEFATSIRAVAPALNRNQLAAGNS